MRVLTLVFRRFILLLTLLPFPAAAGGASVPGVTVELLADAAEGAVKDFVVARGIDSSKPSQRFVGFVAGPSAEKPGTVRVEIVHRFTEDDVWIDPYECSAEGCIVQTGRPRCFYVADSRLFSVADFAAAMRLTTERAGPIAVRKIKSWQTGETLYARFSRAGAGGPDLIYECGKVGGDVRCVEAESARNEP